MYSQIFHIRYILATIQFIPFIETIRSTHYAIIKRIYTKKTNNFPVVDWMAPLCEACLFNLKKSIVHYFTHSTVSCAVPIRKTNKNLYYNKRLYDENE